MKVTLLVVGKTTDPHIVALIDDYKRRLTHYLPFEMVVIPELKNAKNLTEEQQKQQEGELILKAVCKGATAHVVLLDEHGCEYRSVAFADYLQKKYGMEKYAEFWSVDRMVFRRRCMPVPMRKYRFRK